MRSVLVVVAAGAALAGCGAPASAPPAPPATSTTSAAAPAAPGSVAVTGAVKTPSTLTTAQLTAMPQRSVTVTYASGKGQEQHVEAGVPLADLLPVAALATTERKNDQLAFAVLAIGDDGYAATVSYGEVSPDFGNRGVLVALTEDGKALPKPRLVVPGDVKGGRYVSGLVELRVARLG
jgi:DMSO/TMAO reductase YedYZ molybdopterin-dependent catalytic subunit